jgi:hypothetical protein
MIIFYPPANPVCVPVVVADMTDSSDQWSAAEISLLIYQNLPTGLMVGFSPVIYSCKYNYEIEHNGSPLGAALKMTLSASIKVPPSDLISQVSIGFVSSAVDPGAIADSLIANPQLNIMYAVVVEKINFVSNVSRSFIAYSSILQPDPLGVSATLIIKGASIDDTLIRSVLSFHLNKQLPLSTQLTTLAASMDYTLDSINAPSANSMPKNEILFQQPSTLPKVLDEICLQNKLMYKIKGSIITLYSQTSELVIDNPLNPKFSFLGNKGSVMWALGVENYANVKFKTPIFDAELFSKIVLFDDSKSKLFTGLKVNSDLSTKYLTAYDMIILRYSIVRNDYELCCEVTATNNWQLSQIRVLDGIMESKIYGAL